jgi:ABC-type transporter Mla maintaining outer membrane lipid asymmetry permease subunit MlaE
VDEQMRHGGRLREGNLSTVDLTHRRRHAYSCRMRLFRVDAKGLVSTCLALRLRRQSEADPTIVDVFSAPARRAQMCADLGAHAIYEGLDAMRAMGISAVQALLVRQVFAGALVALMLFGYSSV